MRLVPEEIKVLGIHTLRIRSHGEAFLFPPPSGAARLSSSLSVYAVVQTQFEKDRDFHSFLAEYPSTDRQQTSAAPQCGSAMITNSQAVQGMTTFSFRVGFHLSLILFGFTDKQTPPGI